jgi:hypothetical protein
MFSGTASGTDPHEFGLQPTASPGPTRLVEGQIIVAVFKLASRTESHSKFASHQGQCNFTLNSYVTASDALAIHVKTRDVDK